MTEYLGSYFVFKINNDNLIYILAFEPTSVPESKIFNFYYLYYFDYHNVVSMFYKTKNKRNVFLKKIPQ